MRDFPTNRALEDLPKGNGCSRPVKHEGGPCPVHPLQPVSVWFRNFAGQEFWEPYRTADQVPWNRPLIYRTRTPHNGHPYAVMLRGMKSAMGNEQPQLIDPMQSLAQSFERMVDALENYLARCGTNG